MVRLNINDMRKLVTIIALLCCTFCAFAQEEVQQEDPKVTELRQQIGIDYSMPDFKTKKIDGAIIGTHLAGCSIFYKSTTTMVLTTGSLLPL